MYPTFPFTYFPLGDDYIISNNLDVTASSTVCADITGGNPITINPLTANSNLVAGDVCLIAIFGRINNNDTRQCTITPPASSGWSHLLGVSGQPGDSSYESRAAVWYLWKIYQDSDNTNLDFTPTDTDHYCYVVYALKGLSKRCPFPSVYGINMGPTLNQDYQHAGIYVPPMLQANPFGNIMLMMPNRIVDIDIKNVAPYDFDPATSTAYMGGTPPHSLNYGCFITNALVNNTDMQHHGMWVLKGLGNDGHQNRIATTGSAATAGALNVGTTGTQGVASVNGHDFDRTVYATSYAPTLTGDSSTKERWIEWSFDATAGDKICALWRGWAARSNSYGNCALIGLVDPNGNKMSGVAINDQNQLLQMNDASVNWSADGFSATDDWGGFSRQNGSAFVQPHSKVCWFQDTATITGTHKLRLYFFRYLDTSLSWTIGGSTVNTHVGTDYVGVGIGGFPSELTNSGTPVSSGTDNAYSKTMSTPFWLGAGSSNWNRLTDWPVNEAGRQALWAVGLGYPNSDFPVPMLINPMSQYGPQRPYGSDTNWLGREYDAAKSISGGTCTVGTNFNMYHATRPMYPYYYASENATSPTIGKYYWEITLNNVPNSGQFAFGFGNTRKAEHNELTDQGGGCVYRGDGAIFELKTGVTTSTGNDTLAANDVVSVAVDYDNDVVTFRRNNIPQTSTTISTCGLISQDFKAMVWHVESGNAIGYTVNLTGPFVYTKPTGFVAYDWTNEVT